MSLGVKPFTLYHHAVWLRNNLRSSSSAFLSSHALCCEDIDVKMMIMFPMVPSGADDLCDPVSEPGDASVDAIVVWTPAASAPAHHSG